MTVENYAVRFTSYLKVEYSGTYTFYTLSGDGSALYIDGKMVVDNDGLHGKREASADLSMDRGFYKFEVVYFYTWGRARHGYGGGTLHVEWEGPGVMRSTVPKRALFVDKPAEALNVVPITTLLEAAVAKAADRSLTRWPTFVMSPNVCTGFGLTLQGNLFIPRGGKYQFWLCSADGAKMYLDGDVVIDNDNVHGYSCAGTGGLR